MSNHTIMVVDDNATTRRMVKTALTRHGYSVVEAADGKTARELVVSERPSVVLQDLMLPDVDGFDLVGELRELAHADIAIIAFSGFVSKLDEARVSAVGFDDMIAKPIAPSRLLPMIEAHLPAPVAANEQFGNGRRLLVVDDDPLQLKLASFRLGRLGFDVETAPDGAQALAAIQRRCPDIVVSDVMMPELDGFGLAMALRQDPKLKELPLVLVTSSYIEASDRELARRAGANDLVIRTPELAEVVEILRKTLTRPASSPAIDTKELDNLEKERNRRVVRQLERQVMLNSGLAKRNSALASELTVLSGLGETMLQQRDVVAALDDSLAACFDAGGVTAGALYVLDGKKLRIRAIGEHTWKDEDLQTLFGHQALLDDVLKHGKTVYSEGNRELLARSHADALLLVPLGNAKGPLGALLMTTRARDIDGSDWAAFGAGVASQISTVLTLSRAYADVEDAERKAAQHAALLAAVVESAPDTVLQLDTDAKVVFINRTTPPHRPEDVVGKSWVDVLELQHRDKARAAFAMALGGASPEVEIQVTENATIARSYHCRLAPVRQDGKIIGVVIVARDVTDKKQTEMQLMLADRMASVGTLAAGVAHEINNPLAAVIANLDMAMEDVTLLGETATLPPDLLEELRDARTSADRVREIVRDLKLFSRTQEERYGAVNVEKTIDSTLRMAWNEVRHRAKLVKNYGNVPRVVANESRLGQVLLNLIVNAVQAIPEGNYEANEIRVTTKQDGEHVVIDVSDTGAGIPVDVRGRLFTPFFTTKPVGVGTGLGLAISHRIMSSMNGSITFDTEVGKGTTFHLTLPVAGPTVAPVTKKVPMIAKAVRRGRVLVIDDEESLGQAIRRYLSIDHDVEAVTSARVALDMLARGDRYDVILCDLMMPQITGMEVHDTVAKIDQRQAQRIVFVTGGAFTEAARKFFENTPNQRIEKPFDLKTLRLMVNELIV
ncbi:MAG TPA: response regulator [Kofleriaceae bacterium]|nr:response regulator [Kofleriaceae bacterium]